MASSLPACESCGYVLPKSNFNIPCPNCGAARRMTEAPARVENQVKLRFRQRWPGFLGWLADAINRLQWTWRRIFSRDILVFDLSSSSRSHAQTSRVNRVPARPEKTPLVENPGEIFVFQLSSGDFLEHTPSGHNGSNGGNGNGKANGKTEVFGTGLPRF